MTTKRNVYYYYLRSLQTWSADNCISWTSKENIVNCEIDEISEKMSNSTLLFARQWQTDESLRLSNDISERIRQRALNGYGIQVSYFDWMLIFIVIF